MFACKLLSCHTPKESLRQRGTFNDQQVTADAKNKSDELQFSYSVYSIHLQDGTIHTIQSLQAKQAVRFHREEFPNRTTYIASAQFSGFGERL
jgi:hypothetical protein